MTWQQAMMWYAGIGVIALAAIFATHYFVTSKSANASLYRALDEINRTQKKLSNRDKPRWKRGIEYALEQIVAPVIATSLIVVAWPFAIWWKVREMWLPEMAEPTREKEFAVEQEHLLRRQELDELEARERVTDPLGAVPDLPFGHLNSVWLQFKAKLGPEDSIWTFSAHWTSRWGAKEICEGYVIVGLDGIGPHFLTTRRVLKDD